MGLLPWEYSMRSKHRKDQKHGKNGWVGGNPRYKRSKATTIHKHRSMGKN